MLHPTSAHAQSELGNAVVKVFTTSSAPDLERPWQRAPMESKSGSGLILESGRVLTNAHVVSNAVTIDVKLDGATKRYPAKIAFVGHASDLALLEVEDQAFFKGSRHLELGVMPCIQDEVTVLGYPEGGDSLSITAGVVSRIVVGSYAHSLSELLLVQIDAAINPGNSGGPVIADKQLIGIATQGREDLQGTGYMVPVPMIRQFLEDTEDGRVDGPQDIGIETQDLESPAHHARYELAPDETGVLVFAVNHGSPAWGVIQPGDVITAIDGESIANDLSVASEFGTRLSWSALLSEKQTGEDVSIQLVRYGQRLDRSVRLHSWRALVPGLNMGDAARYRVFGGLVFRPLTADYLYISLESADIELMNIFNYQNLRTPDRREVLFVSQVLPGEVSRGYLDRHNEVVGRVNGRTPRDLAHLNEIIDSATGTWLEIETPRGFRFVLDLKDSKRTTPAMIERFAIGDDRSPRGETMVVERVRPQPPSPRSE
jgi:S1-C subfamily serine protease